MNPRHLSPCKILCTRDLENQKELALTVSQSRCLEQFQQPKFFILVKNDLASFFQSIFDPQLARKLLWGHAKYFDLRCFSHIKNMLTCKIELEKSKIIIFTQNKKFGLLELFLTTALPTERFQFFLVLEISMAQNFTLEFFKIYDNQ